MSRGGSNPPWLLGLHTSRGGSYVTAAVAAENSSNSNSRKQQQQQQNLKWELRMSSPLHSAHASHSGRVLDHASPLRFFTFKLIEALLHRLDFCFCVFGIGLIIGLTSSSFFFTLEKEPPRDNPKLNSRPLSSVYNPQFSSRFAHREVVREAIKIDSHGRNEAPRGQEFYISP